MKKHLKRLLSLMMAVLLCIGVMPSSAFAASYDYDGDISMIDHNTRGYSLSSNLPAPFGGYSSNKFTELRINDLKAFRTAYCIQFSVGVHTGIGYDQSDDYAAFTAEQKSMINTALTLGYNVETGTKYGGSAMSNEELQKNVIKDVTLLKLVGFKPIIVHGGGKEISRWVGKVGKEAKFVNGLRVTDEETMEIAEMVLNKVNKSLVTMVEELGVKAVGVSGKDGGLLQVEKKYSDGQDIGYVGEITGVNPDILFDMLEKDYLPIIAPIGLDKDYHTYNINADDAACAIAKAVHAEKLAFLTDIEGLYKDINDKSTFISRLTASEAEGLIQDGYIGGGMLPKLNNCTSAIRNGVNRVHILDGRLAHCLLLEIFTNQGIGTAIVSDEEEK